MTSLEINGTNYPLKFGLGFMQAVNRKYKAEAESAGIERDDGGLMLLLLRMVGDKSIFALIDVIMEAAKSAPENQLKRDELVEWIENDETDIDTIFAEVESFFEKSNCCKNTLRTARKQVAMLQAEIEATAETE